MAVSQRKDGTMRLPSGSNNRRLFLEKMGLNHKDLVTPVLEHGKMISRVGKKDKIINSCDGVVTDEKGVILSVTVADCLPIFLFDPEREAIGLIHAGWRGISKGIIENTVNFFVKEFASQPEKITAVIGPGLCQNHFEVGKDVALKFANYPEAVIVNRGRILVDIKRVAGIQLKESGLISEKIQTDLDCTFCLDSEYFSYRRDGPQNRTEVMLCVLALKK